MTFRTLPRSLRVPILSALLSVMATGLQPVSADAQDFGGVVGGFCSIESDWTQVSQSGGAGGGEFSGGVWRIPEAGFVDSQSQSLGAGAEPRAIRIATSGSCNAPHRITLTSDNGGLQMNSATPVPPGFSNVRPMTYEAHWSSLDAGMGGDGAPFGPAVQVTTSHTSSAARDYLINGQPIPGVDRRFDLVLGFAPGTSGQRLLAGTYTDTVTVTISPVD